jgi:hypothetical protein
LIKDDLMGTFDTGRMESKWNVEIYKTDTKHFGYAYSKLEPLFLTNKEKYLMLDADILMVGPVLRDLNMLTTEFVVAPERPLRLSTYYFDIKRLQDFDPEFPMPKFVFNAGQYVATSSLISRSDFDPIMKWTEPREKRIPGIFQLGEQGIFNYILLKKVSQSKISLKPFDFTLWPRGDTGHLTKEMIERKVSLPKVMHWSGRKPDHFTDLPRSDILRFFHQIYFNEKSDPAFEIASSIIK